MMLSPHVFHYWASFAHTTMVFIVSLGHELVMKIMVFITLSSFPKPTVKTSFSRRFLSQNQWWEWLEKKCFSV